MSRRESIRSILVPTVAIIFIMGFVGVILFERKSEGSDGPNDSVSRNNIATDSDGISFRLDEIVIFLPHETESKVADAIAFEIGGSVVRSDPRLDVYTIKVPLKTVDELTALISTLRKDPRIEDAIRKIIIPLD